MGTSQIRKRPTENMPWEVAYSWDTYSCMVEENVTANVILHKSAGK